MVNDDFLVALVVLCFDQSTLFTISHEQIEAINDEIARLASLSHWKRITKENDYSF